jgi:AraC-like DNA-binding protein
VNGGVAECFNKNADFFLWWLFICILESVRMLQQVRCDITSGIRDIVNPSQFYEGLKVPEFNLPEEILLFYRNNKMDTNHKGWHHRHVLIINMESAANVIVDDLFINFKPDHAFIIFPYQFHHYANMNTDKCLWLFITFNIPSNEDITSLKDVPVKLSEDMLRELSKIIKCYNGTDRDSDKAVFVPLFLRAFLQEMVLSVKEKGGGASKKKAKRNAAENIVQRVSSFVVKNLSHPVSIQDVASELAISESHLRNTFKEVTGTGLGSFIRKFKVHRAGNMLGWSDASISEVSLRCGFDSQYSFSRTFKNEMGISPTEYRDKFNRHSND